MHFHVALVFLILKHTLAEIWVSCETAGWTKGGGGLLGGNLEK